MPPVPSHPQNAAKVRGFSRIASAFTAETDCVLEGTGFEPSVTLAEEAAHLATHHAELVDGYPSPLQIRSFFSRAQRIT